MALQMLVPDQLWCAQQPIKFGPFSITTRMTVVRLADRRLWVHSPIALTAELQQALDALGEVRHVVAPNNSHHLFFSAFLAAYPNATGHVAPGLLAKRPELAGAQVLAGASPWAPELQQWFIEGLPLIGETVWFHVPSGTLILTDLLFCFGPSPHWLANGVARLLGVHNRLAMSRTMRLAVRDHAALARSVAPLLALPVERIVVAHDQIITRDAARQLRQAFEGLPGL